MKLFRPGASPHQTALAMVGAKAGSAVVIIGAEDPAFSAEVALVTGLNGRTLIVVAAADAEPRVEAAATNAGATSPSSPAWPMPARTSMRSFAKPRALSARVGVSSSSMAGRWADSRNSWGVLRPRQIRQVKALSGPCRGLGFAGLESSGAKKGSATSRERNKTRFLRGRSLR